MGQREGELLPGCSCHWATTEGTSFRSVLEAESCPLRHPEIQAPPATRVPAPPETVAFSSERDMWPRAHTAAPLPGRSLHFSLGQAPCTSRGPCSSSQTWRGSWGRAGCVTRTTWLESAPAWCQRGERGQQGDTLRASLPIPAPLPAVHPQDSLQPQCLLEVGVSPGGPT